MWAFFSLFPLIHHGLVNKTLCLHKSAGRSYFYFVVLCIFFMPGIKLTYPNWLNYEKTSKKMLCFWKWLAFFHQRLVSCHKPRKFSIVAFYIKKEKNLDTETLFQSCVEHLVCITENVLFCNKWQQLFCKQKCCTLL